MPSALVWVVLVGVLGLCIDRATAYFCVAMSGSGQHMLLTGNHILVSSDYGVTFEQIPDFLVKLEQWYGCAVDESGQHMAVGSYTSGLYVSADFGKTWTKSNLGAVSNWYKITTSAAGDRMAAIYSDNADYQGRGSVMVSSNAGVTWTGTGASGTLYVDIISDDSGGFLATLVGTFEKPGSQLVTSDDVGNNWSFVNSVPGDTYYSIAADAKAQRLFITGNKGVYATADRGVTWTTSANPVTYFCRVASSASGQQLLAGAKSRELYTSSDFGQSWKMVLNRNDSWISVASNADFSVLAAASTWSGVYLSHDGGATWVTPLSTPSPSARPSQKSVSGLP